MAIYANGALHKMTLGGFTCNMELHAHKPITNGARLISSDDCILKNVNGVYLTTIKYVSMSTSDNSILKDANELYLKVKESD